MPEAERHDTLNNGPPPSSSTDIAPVVFARAGDVFARSRDVAVFFEKRHDHVLRDIDNLIAQEPGLLVGTFVVAFLKSGESRDNNDLPKGRTYRQFDMTRDGFTLLAMGFTGPKALGWKLKYIEAFNKMEAETRLKTIRNPMEVLRDPAAMRTILLDYTEKVIALEQTVIEMSPKADAWDRIGVAVTGALSITEAAKALQIRPKDLFVFLKANGWIYRGAGSANFLGYQDKTSANLLEHKVATVLRADGSERIAEQVRVTPKGIAKLAKMLNARTLI